MNPHWSKWTHVIAICALWATVLPCQAQTITDLSPLDDQLKAILASPSATEKSIAKAHNFSFFCANCHGPDGNSLKTDVPNLAGQNPHYLLTQIDKFVKGQRQYEFMQGLMKMLSEEDRINASVFYSSKAVKPASNVTSSNGQKIYLQRCVMCHGQQGLGGESIPRLAGQQIGYLRASITRYRDKTGERIYAPMSAITNGLQNNEIVDLANYLSSLR